MKRMILLRIFFDFRFQISKFQIGAVSLSNRGIHNFLQLVVVCDPLNYNLSPLTFAEMQKYNFCANRTLWNGIFS